MSFENDKRVNHQKWPFFGYFFHFPSQISSWESRISLNFRFWGYFVLLNTKELWLRLYISPFLLKFRKKEKKRQKIRLSPLFRHLIFWSFWVGFFAKTRIVMTLFCRGENSLSIGINFMWGLSWKISRKTQKTKILYWGNRLRSRKIWFFH